MVVEPERAVNKNPSVGIKVREEKEKEMPTFAPAPLESLLEPGVRNSLRKPLDQEDPNQSNGGRRHLYISPVLYVTPEQAPILEHPSPGPISPSPYVVNLKRRRGGNETRRGGPAEVPDLPSGNEGGEFSLDEEVGDNFVNESLDANDADGDGDDDDGEGFLDPRSEAMSVRNEMEANDLVFGSQMESHSLVSAQGDYFDANDDFSCDCSTSNVPPYGSRVESELQAIKFNILDEIERRNSAEETLMLLRSQWERIGDLMSKAGLTFPEPPASDNMQLESSSTDQFFQEVLVTRFVAEAIARDQARAEAEEAAAMIIESKDQELMRLRDRLQYYETVNHELSQRKLVEVARRQQQKRSRRTWIWSFVGLSVAIGLSFVAYSYMSHSSRNSSSLESDDLTDPSCSPSDTS